MALRIIFVGLHNKPERPPLCTSTKTGRLIREIIWQLPIKVKTIKSNIFNVDYMPERSLWNSLVSEWYWEYVPTEGDIVVLLGNITQKMYKTYCDHNDSKVIEVAHPASKWSHNDMDEYVKNVSDKIKIELNN